MYMISINPPSDSSSIVVNGTLPQKEAWPADKIRQELDQGRKDWCGLDLRLGDFSKRDLRDCKFNFSCMDGVSFDGSELGDCSFHRTSLNHASFVGARSDAGLVVFSEANLSDANLEDANLLGCNFEGARLCDAKLNRVQLISCKFVGANLRGAQCEGANFTGANLEGARLEHTFLKDANLQFAHCPGCNFTSACLESTHFELANLKGAKLFIGQESGGGWLSTPILSEAEMDDTTQLLFGDRFDLHREWTTSGTSVKNSIDTVPHQDMRQKFVELYDGHRQKHQKAQEDFLNAKAFEEAKSALSTKYKDVLSQETFDMQVVELQKMPSLDLVEMLTYGIPLSEPIVVVSDRAIKVLKETFGLKANFKLFPIARVDLFQSVDTFLNDKGQLQFAVRKRAIGVVAQWIEGALEPNSWHAMREMNFDALCPKGMLGVIARYAPKSLGTSLNWPATEVAAFAQMPEEARENWAGGVSGKNDLVNARPATDFRSAQLTQDEALQIVKTGVQADVLDLVRMAVFARTGFTTDEMKAVLHLVDFATHPEHFIMVLTGMDEKTFRQTGVYKELKAAMRPKDKEEALSTFIADELIDEKNAAWQDRFFKHLSTATTEQKAVVCASLINGHNSQLYENDGFVKSLAIPEEEKKTFSASLKKHVRRDTQEPFKNGRLAGVNNRLAQEFGTLG
jgi:uncharacterized protein YjbI with pentapeptide repeats